MKSFNEIFLLICSFLYKIPFIDVVSSQDFLSQGNPSGEGLETLIDNFWTGCLIWYFPIFIKIKFKQCDKGSRKKNRRLLYMLRNCKIKIFETHRQKKKKKKKKNAHALYSEVLLNISFKIQLNIWFLYFCILTTHYYSHWIFILSNAKQLKYRNRSPAKRQFKRSSSKD